MSANSTGKYFFQTTQITKKHTSFKVDGNKIKFTKTFQIFLKNYYLSLILLAWSMHNS